MVLIINDLRDRRICRALHLETVYRPHPPFRRFHPLTDPAGWCRWWLFSVPPSHRSSRVVPLVAVFGSTLSPFLQVGAAGGCFRPHPLTVPAGWCRWWLFSAPPSHRFRRVVPLEEAIFDTVSAGRHIKKADHIGDQLPDVIRRLLPCRLCLKLGENLVDLPGDSVGGVDVGVQFHQIVGAVVGAV